MTIKVSRRTHKIDIYFANEVSGLAFLPTDLEHIFGSTNGNELEVMLRRKGLHKPKFAYDIVCKHSLMMFTDLIGFNIVRWRHEGSCAALFYLRSQLKTGEDITTGHYMNYHKFSNLLFRPMLKKLFSKYSRWLERRGRLKKHFVTVCITRLVLMFRKASSIHF